MHILLIHQAFVFPEEAGGTRHFEFARYLVRKGLRFSIVASNLSYLSGQKIAESDRLVTQQQIHGVNVIRAKTLSALHRNFFWRVVTYVNFMVTSIIAATKASQVDLIVGTSPPIFQAVSAWIVARIRKRPFLLEIRDLWPEFAIDMGVLSNPLLIWLSRRLEALLYRQATHILVNSPAYVDYLIKKGLPAEKVSLIPNGVDPDMFSPDMDGTPLRKAWWLNDNFIVTYTGALGPANDIGTILNAARILQKQENIHFVLAGDGKDRSKLEALAAQMQLNNVTFLGARPKTEVPVILAASDACVATLLNIPMFRTTYPNKVFDYMAAGRPTVLAIDGVIRNVIEAAEGGLYVEPGNAAALAEALAYLATHREEAKRMGLNARRYVVEHFSRERHGEEFGQLIEKVVKSNDE